MGGAVFGRRSLHGAEFVHIKQALVFAHPPLGEKYGAAIVKLDQKGNESHGQSKKANSQNRQKYIKPAFYVCLVHFLPPLPVFVYTIPILIYYYTPPRPPSQQNTSNPA
jgi:hypothetical protein